jgi:hypothetical protein
VGGKVTYAAKPLEFPPVHQRLGTVLAIKSHQSSRSRHGRMPPQGDQSSHALGRVMGEVSNDTLSIPAVSIDAPARPAQREQR